MVASAYTSYRPLFAVIYHWAQGIGIETLELELFWSLALRRVNVNEIPQFHTNSTLGTFKHTWHKSLVRTKCVTIL